MLTKERVNCINLKFINSKETNEHFKKRKKKKRFHLLTKHFISILYTIISFILPLLALFTELNIDINKVKDHFFVILLIYFSFEGNDIERGMH